LAARNGGRAADAGRAADDGDDPVLQHGWSAQAACAIGARVGASPR
jgi:hypothetical protein